MSETSVSISERIILRTASFSYDVELLKELYFGTRDDITGVFADPMDNRQLLGIQFRAQTAAYAQQFPDAKYQIILMDNEPVGRTIVDVGAEAATLVDIALLPKARNLGIGTIVIQRLVDECSNRRIPVFLQVTKTNRARALYERLGFHVTGEEDSVRILMRHD